jgi:peptidoglycan/xylan/chitin deacetylase (PgdA/CDA1 family)
MKFIKYKALFVCVILSIFIIEITFSYIRVKAVENKFYDDGLGKEKIVYLTFDDGPIPGITEKILNVLSEHNVKATFFVVGKEINERETLLEKIYKEGHGIGLHTYSHKFSLIYKNDEAFIEEMDKTKEIVESVTGYKAKAIRFPGGSDLMLSYKLLDKLHAKGYLVYDWNANLEDGTNGRASVEKLLSNAKKIKGNKDCVFILAHCNSNNMNTCKSLPYIIGYYKNLGYKFKVIDNNTGEYFYKIRKSSR